MAATSLHLHHIIIPMLHEVSHIIVVCTDSVSTNYIRYLIVDVQIQYYKTLKAIRHNFIVIIYRFTGELCF